MWENNLNVLLSVCHNIIGRENIGKELEKLERSRKYIHCTPTAAAGTGLMVLTSNP